MNYTQPKARERTGRRSEVVRIGYILWLTVWLLGTANAATTSITQVNPAAGATDVFPDVPIKAVITDADTKAQTNTIQLWVNGVDVTTASVIAGTTNGATVTYLPADFWPLKSTNTARLVFRDNAAPANLVSNQWQFTVIAALTTIPTSYAKPMDAGQTPGFMVRTSQSDSSQNSTGWSEDQLAGLHRIISLGFDTPQVINYWGNGSVGNFGNDSLFPGLVNGDNFALEAVAYLALNKGVYRFGVNSDDGFRLSVGSLPQEVGVVLGEYSGGRGASDTIFDFLVLTNGVYPFRLTFEEGTGGYEVEWFSADRTTGTRTLINTNSPSAVLAYRFLTSLPSPVTITQQPTNIPVLSSGAATFIVTATNSVTTNAFVQAYQWQTNGVNIPGANWPTYTTPLLLAADTNKYRCQVSVLGYPPATSAEAAIGTLTPITVSSLPADGATGVMPDATLSLAITNRSFQVNSASVQLWVNGLRVTNNITISNLAAGLTLSYVPVDFWGINSTNRIRVVFTDDAANTVTNQWQFTTVTSLPVIPASYAKPVDSGQTPGFTVRTSQSDSSQNSTGWSEDQLAGLHTIISQGFDTPQVINYLGQGSPGNFGKDNPFPGLVNGNNFALEAVAYLALNRGVYRFGVNSDDGFRLSVGSVPQEVGVVLGEYSGGRGAGDTVFEFLVLTNGVYPFRLTYEEGGGDYEVEWFSVDRTSGNRALINDTNATGFVLAYRLDTAVTNPIVLIQSPATQTVVQNRPAIFNLVVVSGSVTNPLNVFYQWQANGTNLPGANAPSLTLPLAQLSDNQSKFRCLVTQLGYPTIASAEATLTVTPDTTPPQAVSAATLIAGGTVGLRFDELVDPTTATNANNYVLSNGAMPIAATLKPDGKTIALSVSAYSFTNFTLTLNNVKDLAGNPIAHNTAVGVTVLPLEAVDVGTPGSDPLEPGSTFAAEPGSFDVVASGSDIWNNQDHFHFDYQVRAGDFDVQVQLTREDYRNNWTKAGLMVRENLSPGSRNLKVVADPAQGANAYEIHVRTDQDGGTGGWPGISNNSSPGIPNAWMRLKRAGDVFTAYRSANGTDWTQMAQITATYSNRVLVGLCTSSVNNSAGQSTVAWYRNFGNVTPATNAPLVIADLAIKNAADPEALYGGNGLYQLIATNDQVKSQVTLPYAPVTYQVRIANAGDVARTFVLRAVESPDPGWAIAYWSGASNITAQVLGSTGYTTTNLAPAASELITIQVTPGFRPPAFSSKAATLQVFLDTYASNVRDVVQALTTVRAMSQPDLMIRRDLDLNYAGEHVYNLTGDGQTKTLATDANVPVYYLVRLANDGNLPQAFSLTAPAGPSGWTVRYYAAQHSLQFDGQSAYVDLGAWSPGTQWTVQAWVRPSATPSGRHSIAGGLYECRDWGITLQDGQLAVLLQPPGSCTQSLGSGDPVSVGTWYHVAGTCDGTNAVIYVNGVAKKSAPVAAGFIGTAAGTRIGGEVCCGGNNFPGLINQVSIWNRALTSNEINGFMARSLTGTEAGLLGYWPLNETGGTVAEDHSTNNHNGTLVNNPQWQSVLDLQGNALDITPIVSGPGWTNINLLSQGSQDFLVVVTPDASVAGGASLELPVTAKSLADASAADVVKAVTTVNIVSTVPLGGTYSVNADFERGALVGVEDSSVANQLQLAAQGVTFPFIWVPNSNEGTVSKIDVRTGRELGRYRVTPRTDSSPSRTTVDLYGNCWVANRTAATVVKIGLLENGQYTDRNGNGLIETSRDLNNDGDITGSEMLAWGQDECVLLEVSVVKGQEGVHVPGDPATPYGNDYWNPGPRGIAVDAQNNVWVGTYGTKMFYYLDGNTGKILRQVDVSSVNHTSYGAVMSANGIVWSSGHDKGHILRLDPTDNSFSAIPVGHFVYGLGLDRNNHLFVSGWQDSKLSRFNVLTGTKDWTVNGVYESRGIAVTDDGDVWVANSTPRTVTRWSNDGLVKATFAVGSQPTGVAVDAFGKVWVVDNGDEYISRIDPDTGATDLNKRIIGASHYGYSDMTGILARNATTRLGYWTLIHNSQTPNTPWGSVAWHSQGPAGTGVKVRVRSSNDQQSWSLWENAINNTRLYSTPPGKYLEVEVTLQSAVAAVSPILYDLTVTPASQINLGQQVYFNDFQGPSGPEWSVTNLDLTPAGSRRFLGRFGNQTASLTLTNLPRHAAVSVLFDLFVIGSWDGNSASDGPDTWELNVGGGLKLLHTTFNNGPTNSVADGQAYPDSFPGGSHPARTGAVETNSLGFLLPGGGVMDSVYQLGYTLPHSADTLALNFTASGLSTNLAQESWGLDNVRVYVTPAAPIRLLPVGFQTPGQFHLQLYADPQLTYTLEASTNLVDWSAISTNLLTTDHLDLLDTNAAAFPRRFYRANQKQ